LRPLRKYIHASCIYNTDDLSTHILLIVPILLTVAAPCWLDSGARVNKEIEMAELVYEQASIRGCD